ncbi:lipid IV(A) 3-deoxy-D-manno-octulosonic acid transferase [Vibrio fluvialis]|uniref:lipid IV(A) 3-deoxy-D-manno-octulosonic acid transferase n=1 Tax=Vibrio fluvialis TaxID=676 RepID=UPI0005C8885A|nr:lipid IV(A) 3-deoxy-D-manno-octulosonic acid transferase [Vibrio fluvialis]
MIRALYTLCLMFAAPFLMWGLYRNKPGKPSVGKRWREHFGFTPPLQIQQPPIWIHAVSVGETIAVTPLLKKLKARYPQTPILITTTTPTGAEQAQKLAGIAEHRYMPFDFPFALKRFIRQVKPSQLLIMETELWPNTLHTVAKAGIPITVINARLSERSCRRYGKFQAIFDLLAKNLSQILCQYPDDAKRFIRLGVDPEKIQVTGSIKFDIEISPNVQQDGNKLRQYLGINRPVWIAASTHQGEDEQVLTAHKGIVAQYPDALLILVPRHPERFNAVFSLAKQQFHTVRRTEQTDQSLDKNSQVYLADTMGEMLTLIQASDICFMGGSLLGNKVGGHNMLEPAALGKSILTGPSYFNFTEVMHLLLANQAVKIVSSPAELTSNIIFLFNNRSIMLEQKQRAYDCVKTNQGAIKKTLSLLVNNHI